MAGILEICRCCGVGIALEQSYSIKIDDMHDAPLLCAVICEDCAKKLQSSILNNKNKRVETPKPKVTPTKKNKGDLWSEREINTLIHMASNGAFIEEIAETLGRTVNSCRLKYYALRNQKIVADVGLKSRPKPKVKSPYDLSVDYGKVLALYKAHWTVQEIARDCGISEMEVRQIIKYGGLSNEL